MPVHKLVMTVGLHSSVDKILHRKMFSLEATDLTNNYSSSSDLIWY